ncbi:MAG: hypothetical protein IIX50_00630, partial [Bacteroidaceae bacterium]|nr:hypothetical protein [Bacteroidaceae bacterium]
LSTGSVFGQEYWEDVKGNFALENGNITMTFEDGDKYEGHFDIIPGKAFSIYNASGRRFTYDYCANDLADEILGMWVCNDTPAEGEGEMMIETFYENGKSVLTGFLPLEDGSELVKNNETDYNVVGDLLFVTIPDDKLGGAQSKYVVQKLIYSPNGTSAGDIMTLKAVVKVGDQVVEGKSSWLRIKQHLELAGNKYDYIKTFVSNVSGEDKDIPFLNTSFNFVKMDGSIIDKFLKSILFNVEFPNDNTINYSFLLEGQNMPMSAPIEVEGNKMTIKMSANDPIFHDVVVYTFQDQDNTQMHMYMPTSSFEKFFANTSVSVMLGYGQLDKNDADAIAAVYQNVADAVHSINLSLVMTKAAK